MRSLLTTGALAATLVAGAVGTVASAPVAAAQDPVHAQVCIAYGGEVVESSSSPTGFVCRGGSYDGAPAYED